MFGGRKIVKIFPYPSVLTNSLGVQKNLLNSKEPSHFEYPKHMFWLRNKKIIFLSHSLTFLKVLPGAQLMVWPVVHRQSLAFLILNIS